MQHGILEVIFRAGVHGSAENFRQWVEMYRQLARETLPDNLIQFDPFLKKQVGEINRFDSITLDEMTLQNELIRLFDAGLTEVILPYSELRWRNRRDWACYTATSESFFVSNTLQFSPLQYIRSRVQNFCEVKGISNAQRDEIVISVTEAAENAIKYSNIHPVYVEHGIEGDEYFIRAMNSVDDVNLKQEISRGKFSEDVSLMRGVLVMSKLLDYLDIVRDADRRLVEFVGRKKISLHTHSLMRV